MSCDWDRVASSTYDDAMGALNDGVHARKVLVNLRTLKATEFLKSRRVKQVNFHGECECTRSASSEHVQTGTSRWSISMYKRSSSARSPQRHAMHLRFSYVLYLTIRTDEGVRPASLSVMDMSTSPWKVFLGNVVVKLVTIPLVSAWSCCASSNSVVSAGNVFMMLPESVCNLSRASLWSTLGLGEAAMGAGAGAAAASGALPSRAALASSALRFRSALSASILALMRFLASISSSFS